MALPFLLGACASTPYAAEQVNAHLWRSSQPVTAADWADLRSKIGVGGVVVKLNDSAEGSDAGAAAAGLVDVDFAIEPKGDGPIYAQVEGVFTRPDETKVLTALSIMCDPRFVVAVHCSHGFDRTGYAVARERVQCEGWTPEVAHEEWHRKAHYFPYGDRIPAPGLEAAWSEFVEQFRSPEHAAALTNAAQSVLEAVGR